MAAAMMPIGPAPVISTSSPIRSNDSAVCVALPNGSKIDARSSAIELGNLNAFTAGKLEVLAEAARPIDADADRRATKMPPTRAAVATMTARDVTFARHAIARRQSDDVAADLGDRRRRTRAPTTIGTGMVFCDHSSQL